MKELIVIWIGRESERNCGPKFTKWITIKPAAALTLAFLSGKHSDLMTFLLFRARDISICRFNRASSSTCSQRKTCYNVLFLINRQLVFTITAVAYFSPTRHPRDFHRIPTSPDSSEIRVVRRTECRDGLLDSLFAI